jgi:hypothetical protein
MKLFEDTVYKVETYTEGVDSKGRPKLFLKGKSQQTTENQNKRQYPEEVWDYLMTEDKRYKRRLEKRLHLGSIGHPKDGIFDPEKSAIVMTDQRREDTDIITTHEVLNTPSGNILRSMHESGVELGLSSRGSGESYQKEDLTIVKKGFDLEGYDAVVDPSVEGADPTYELQEEVQKSPTKNFATVMESRMKEDDLTLEEVEFYREFVGTHYKDTTSESYSTVCNLLESKITDLKGDLENISESERKEKFVSMFGDTIQGIVKTYLDEIKGVPSKTDNKVELEKSMAEDVKPVLTEEMVQTKINLSTLETEKKNLENKYGTSKKMIEERDKTIDASTKKYEALVSKFTETEKRLNASKQLLSAALDQIDSMKEEVALGNKKYEAAKKIIGSLQKKLESQNSSSLESVIKAEVAKFPEAVQEKVAATLRTMESFESVLALSSNLHDMTEKMIVDPSLPTSKELEEKEGKDKKTEGKSVTPITRTQYIAQLQKRKFEERKAYNSMSVKVTG